jgi:ATP-dependent DNA helicase DinG
MKLATSDKPKRPRVPRVHKIIKPGGLLSKMLPGYQPRPGQEALAEAVEGAIKAKNHLLSEAPTGTGKSFAYGLPAALYAVVKNETVVIATANITLQEQLIGKDLPLIGQVVEEETGKDLNYLLVKGMSNYLCLDSLEECLRVGEEDWIAELVEWANETETGDKSELEVEYAPNVWSRVSTTSEDCLRDKCKFRDECFVFKARDSRELAHIVVTNYHMLFTDLLVREATGGQAGSLPEYGVLVMDEAHEAKDIAMSFQGYEFQASRARWLANKLRATKIDGASKRADRLLNIAGFFFSRLESYEDPRHKDSIIREPLKWDEGLVDNLQNTSAFLRNHALSQSPKSDDERAAIARVAKLGEVFLRRSAEISSVCSGIGDPPALPYGMVYYTEKKHRVGTSLCCKGVEVQEFLKGQLFDRKTVVCTSATLTTGGTFDFTADELGLRPPEYSCYVAPDVFSPENMLVILPAGIPSPKDRDAHMHATAEVVAFLHEELGGQIMVLFTSYKALGFTATHLSKVRKGAKIYVQGELPRSRIISLFKSDPTSIILATSSFWQGVDIPGQALSCLVIDKFPFLPPTDPVLKYIGEKFDSSMSAFFDYSIPKAVIAMKQGVGRLIRSETDRGVVVLCDNRISTKGYGRQFEGALPYGHYRSTRLEDAKSFLDEAPHG